LARSGGSLEPGRFNPRGGTPLCRAGLPRTAPAELYGLQRGEKNCLIQEIAISVTEAGEGNQPR
jgi:hypothetical protein